MEDPNTLHLYVYCANNPLNYVDPSGHFALAISLAGVTIGIEVVIGVTVVLGAIAVGATIYDRFRYKKKNSYRVKLEIDAPKMYKFKKGFAAMRAHWKSMKGSIRYKLKRFLPRKYHYKRYHIHARIIKNGRTIKRPLII